VTASFSTLTPLQLTAGAGLLANQGLQVSANLILSIDSYSNILPVGNVIALAVGNVGNLSNVTIRELSSMGANSCPALGDSLPSAYANTFGSANVNGFTNFLVSTATTYINPGDLSTFAQLFAQAQGYYTLTNQFINSAVNAQHYLGNTFTNTNNMTTGEITAVNVCTQEFATDLANLGSLINLNNLSELGTPLALLKQLALLGGISSTLAITFAAYGVNLDTVLSLNDQNLTASNTDQKAMYTAMTHITNENGKLREVLQIFGIKNLQPTTVIGPNSAYANQGISVYFSGGVPNSSVNWIAQSTNPNGTINYSFTLDNTGSYTYNFSESAVGEYSWHWAFIATGETGTYTIVILTENSLPAPPPPPGKPQAPTGQTALNITSMADLLNPRIIFPNSFQTLTVTDVNNVSQNIYINSSGAVNNTLLSGLPTTALLSIS